jgi:glycosyltransferase involved in cell wall biosynthesis
LTGNSRELKQGNPRVSVIISFLNAERFMAETIESVFAQTFREWELLLVDDGSTDSSTAMAREYSARHPDFVRYIEHPRHQHRGLVASRKIGMDAARGAFIANLDADDVWLPRKLEQQVAILDAHGTAAMVFGATRFWRSWTNCPAGSQPDSMLTPRVPGNQVYEPPTLLKPFLRNEAAEASLSNCMFRKEVISLAGGFDEAFTAVSEMYEDQAFLAKVYLHLPVFVSDECWDLYRQHPDSLCARVTRAGAHPAATIFYLKWVESYLAAQGALDAETRDIIRGRLWPLQYPSLSQVPQVGALFVGKLKRLGARLFPGWHRMSVTSRGVSQDRKTENGASIRSNEQ